MSKTLKGVMYILVFLGILVNLSTITDACTLDYSFTNDPQAEAVQEEVLKEADQHIIFSGYIDPVTAIYARRIIKSQDIYLLKLFFDDGGMFYICDDNNFRILQNDHGMSSYNSVIGWIHYETRSIYVCDDISVIRETVTHELGHYMAVCVYEGVDMYTEWKQITCQEYDNSGLPYYYHTNIEYFAESYRAYFYGDMNKSKTPETYKFIDPLAKSLKGVCLNGR